MSGSDQVVKNGGVSAIALLVRGVTCGGLSLQWVFQVPRASDPPAALQSQSFFVAFTFAIIIHTMECYSCASCNTKKRPKTVFWSVRYRSTNPSVSKTGCSENERALHTSNRVYRKWESASKSGYYSENGESASNTGRTVLKIRERFKPGTVKMGECL